MPIYYVTNKKPLSHNKGGSKREYKQMLRDEFGTKYARLYNGLPIQKEILQSNIVYIHQVKDECMPDVDNLSKPIVDAFSGVMYRDDSQIIKRSALRLKRSEFQFVTIDATNMPAEIYDDLMEYYDNKETHIVLFEVDRVSLGTIKVGEF